MEKLLEKKTAIITGAANGVGQIISQKFSEEGANLILADMDESNLKKEADLIRKGGSHVEIFCGDLRQNLTIKNLLALSAKTFKNIDILVNASRQVTISHPLDSDDIFFEELMSQNVGVNLKLSREVAKKMIAQNVSQPDPGNAIGSIVNLSSIASHRTLPDTLAYSVSSAALDQLTKSMAISLAESKIRVNAVAIGSVMSSSLRAKLAKNKFVLEDLIAATPLGRLGEASEAAEAVLFLASEKSSFITGTILTVDGGRSLLDRMPAAAY